VHEWIGFSRCVDIAVGGDYLIGIAGDNRVRLKVNGQLVFELDNSNTSNFNYWHVIKVSLNSGVNVIELSGYNDGLIAAFGAEISGPFPQGSLETETQQMNADYAGNIIFSTGEMEGELFDIGENSGWSCPQDGYVLNTCAPAPVCTQLNYAECEDPCAGVICEVGSTCDPDTGACVDCSRSFECVNGGYCETGDQPACWQGDLPVCFAPTHPLSQRFCAPPVDCTETFECVDGSYCETGDDPSCWAGDAPVCYAPDHPLSLRNCNEDPCVGVICGQDELCDPGTGDCVDCSNGYECRNGAYCETSDNPLCWAGDAPVCYEAEHPLS
jgi:hypothetical protein